MHQKIGLILDTKMRHVAVLVLLLTVGQPTHADERSPSPFNVDPWVDVPLVVVSSMLWGIPELVEPRSIAPICNPCLLEDVNVFDRSAVRFYSKNAELTSHLISGLLYTGGYGLSLLNLQGDYGWQGVFEDVVLITQALSVKGVLFQVVSRTVQRPRPVMYRDDVDLELRRQVTSYRSFFSGHTASAFSAATAVSYIYSVRMPESPWRLWVWGVTHTAAAVVGMCRVVSGRHFWSDVLVGAVVGASSGIIAPALHRVREDGGAEGQPRLALLPSGLGVRMTF